MECTPFRHLNGEGGPSFAKGSSKPYRPKRPSPRSDPDWRRSANGASSNPGVSGRASNASRNSRFPPELPVLSRRAAFIAPAPGRPFLRLVPRAQTSRTAWLKAPGNLRGRDFVVGDVHGCFRTLERALVELRFDPERDRLFGVGDLVNRGPNSSDALEWLVRRFEAVALGNHDRAVLRWLELPLGTPPPLGSEWLADVHDADRVRWRAAIAAMPVAITVETPYGAVSIVHAEVPHLVWSESIAMLERGDPGAVDVALLGLPGTSEKSGGLMLSGNIGP